MHRRTLTASASAGAALLLFSIACNAASAAVSGPKSRSFNWVGSSIDHGADNHSWTDPRNWLPKGVPGTGDAVSIDATSARSCAIGVDKVPSGLNLKSLSVAADASCEVGISGGSITVNQDFSWTAGSINTTLTIAANASGTVASARSGASALKLGWPLDLEGTLEIDGASLQLAEGVQLSVEGAAELVLDPGSVISGADCCHHPSVLSIQGGTLSVPVGAPLNNLATISGVAVRDQGGTTSIGAGTKLRIVGGPRGSIADATLQGGGTLVLANPTDSLNTESFADGTRLVLMAGGSLDGPTQFLGDGTMTWLGGHLSDEQAYLLDNFTVAGSHPKIIDKVDGNRSFIQVLNQTTFAAGTDDHHNVLDINGNSFVVFSTLTLLRNVELTGGEFADSQGNVRVDPGPGGTVYSDSNVQFFTSLEFDVLSGTFQSAGHFTQSGGATVVERGAVFRLSNRARPLLIEQGVLTGQGEIDGTVVNAAGTFEPYNSSSDIPLRITGGYSQEPGGQLLLDLTKSTHPLVIGGSATVQGTVTYADDAGFTPGFGDQRRIFGAGTALSWSPSCEETTGSGADTGHWVSSQHGLMVLATFTKGGGGSC